MKQQTIQKSNESESSTFLEYHDDSLYKNCFTCGQGLYPFKHGICRLCGENNWTVEFERPKHQSTEWKLNSWYANPQGGSFKEWKEYDTAVEETFAGIPEWDG